VEGSWWPRIRELTGTGKEGKRNAGGTREKEEIQMGRSYYW
jgi:hypothetical protein